MPADGQPGDGLDAAVAELAAQTRVINRARARQLELVAVVAASQGVECEDGTVEQVLVGGDPVVARLDAAALVAPALGVGAQAAQGWVERAVAMAGPLRSVREAMAAGSVDERRAVIIWEELGEAPAEVATPVAENVVRELEVALAEDPSGHGGVALRRRVRAAIAAVDAEFVRAKAERARADRQLERWVETPGVDTWKATLPAEQAAIAWAAVDELAQQFRRSGQCSSIGQARADALVALIQRQATVTCAVRLMVPASSVSSASASAAGSPALALLPVPVAVPAPLGPADDAGAVVPVAGGLVEVSGLGQAQPVVANQAWVGEQVARARAAGALEAVLVDDTTGAIIHRDPATARVVGTATASTNPTQPPNTTQSPSASHSPASPESDPERTETSYRPSSTLVDAVRQRDGRCRFPGCSINARFCDVDHVRPWPDGPTALDNLVLLCRRHHRVKQLVGWRVQLAPDGVLMWVDPLDHRWVTRPLDHRAIVLPGSREPMCRDVPAPIDPTAQGGAHAPEDVASVLEHALEHLEARVPRAERQRWAATHAQCRRLGIELVRCRRPVIVRGWGQTARTAPDEAPPF